MITGSNGQLGRELIKFYSQNSSIELLCTDVKDLDITKADKVKDYIIRQKPDVIINSAAYTAVDDCEDNQEVAYKVNVEGTKNLVDAIKDKNIIFVQISTDYVFNGEKKEAYVEDDFLDPKTVYGKTKAASEKIVLENLKKYFVIRTAWLYGDGNNFVNTMLKLAKNNKTIKVVNDQLGSPTSTKELVKVIDILIKTDDYGIYNATCEGYCSWSYFAKKIFELTNLPIYVEEVSTNEYQSKARRPLFSVLDNKNLREKQDYQMANWQDAIKEYLVDKIINKEKKSMNEKKVLVTGANGYLGRHVVNSLLKRGCKVIASDLKFDGLDKRVIKCEVPIFSGDENLFKNLGSPDAVIHLAWRNGFVHNADSHILDLPLHYNFLKTLMQSGLKRLSVIGSMHEIGYWEGQIDDKTPANPTSLYGIAKNSLREMLTVLNSEKKVEVTWLRAFYIMGDDLKNNSIFSKIVQKEEEGAEKFPFNSGKNKYDFINVDDLAEQIVEATLQNKVLGIVNCCTGNPCSLAEKVEEFIRENNYKIKLEYGAFPDRPYDSSGIWGDPSKINSIMSNKK
ncbi:dTDP-4-dehydrorhamnose reductase [Thomasclavelia cocleata]|uniref:dTDP-4-dehydrorhamnose reductase n=1 Tax=Thomasclavelia cocleata TaxID=69824 RepID=UPI00243314C9|nr:dTDP-4-dehydrorhamnose reductase [Thomasclavelia cocleata]